MNGHRDGLKATDILRSEIKRLRRSAHALNQEREDLDRRLAMTAQILATLLHRDYPGGTTFTEQDRQVAGQACLFRVSAKALEEGGVEVSLMWVTDEEQKEVDAAKAEKPPQIILPPGA